MDITNPLPPSLPSSRGVVPSSERFSQALAPSCLIAHGDAELIKHATMILRRICIGSRVEAVYTSGEAEEWASRDEWDLLLLGEGVCAREAETTIERLRQRAPRSVILVLGESDDQERAFGMVRAGADYYFDGRPGVLQTEFPQVAMRLLEKRVLRLDQERDRLRLECLSALLTEPILEIDAVGQVRHASRALAMRAGLKLSDLQGSQVSGLVQPSDQDRWHHWFRMAQTGGTAPTRLSVRLRRSRRELPAAGGGGPEVEMAPLYGSDGRFWGAVGVVRDERGAELKAGPAGRITDLLENAAALCAVLMTCADASRRAAGAPLAAGGDALHQVEGVIKVLDEVVRQLRSRERTHRETRIAWGGR